MKLADTKLGDEVIVSLHYAGGGKIRTTVIGKYANSANTPYSLCGWETSPLSRNSSIGPDTSYSIDVELRDNLILIPNIDQYPFSSWYEDSYECVHVFFDPTQKCSQCNISLAHKQFGQNDKLVCVPCKVLAEL